MPKRVNPNLAKIHRSYSVEEVAALFGVHKNTVRRWIKDGLPLCDDRRPALILGGELRGFLQKKRQCHKRRCKLFELYCLRCRSPKRPVGNMVDFAPLSESTGRLIGLCPDCDGVMNRYASTASLVEIQGLLGVSIPKARKHLDDSGVLSLNSDFS